MKNNNTYIFLIFIITSILGFFIIQDGLSKYAGLEQTLNTEQATELEQATMHYDNENLKSTENQTETEIKTESDTQIEDANQKNSETSEQNKTSSKLSLLREYNNDEMWSSGNITINKMLDFNGKSKQEILNIRKYYVKNSIFNTNNYEPSEQVFGQIVDGKPWLGITSLCFGKGENANKGLSEESRFINNPAILIGVEHTYFDQKTPEQCGDVDFLIPAQINYAKDTNTIRVVYNTSSYKGGIFDLNGKYGFKLVLKGLNAVDLGYKYAFVDRTKNIRFNQEPNIKQNVYEFRDFIHLGSSCGVEGGCNNGSPYQPETDFNIIDFPSVMHIKLWKNPPQDKTSNADMTYVLLFR